MHWLWLYTGLSGTGAYYAFWSGIFADITIFTAIGIWYHKHNCHIHHCWRIGRHAVDGTDHIVCRKHHPEGHLTHAKLLEKYRKYHARG